MKMSIVKKSDESFGYYLNITIGNPTDEEKKILQDAIKKLQEAIDKNIDETKINLSVSEHTRKSAMWVSE